MSNVFSFTGTVGRDAEVRTTPNGQTVLNVTVANNIGFGDRQQTIWVRVALWGKRAEGQLQNYLKKGQQVFVSGELSQREYQANDGTTRTSLELNANIIDLLGKRNEQGSVAQPQHEKTPQQQQQQQQQQQSTPAQQNYPANDSYDDVPF
ncbi:single-stranded DNA-binding protein [Methylococcaceae bacterium CS5]|nr:single-stranded DNA-binding protein [Methylococcaceae bacterium CS5]